MQRVMAGGKDASFVMKFRALSSSELPRHDLRGIMGTDATLSPSMSAMAMDLGLQAPGVLPPIAPSNNKNTYTTLSTRLDMDMATRESRAHDNFTNMAPAVM